MLNAESTSQMDILVGFAGRDAVVVVRGRGTFLGAQPLKTFGNEAVEHGARRFYVDLGACHNLDSTFMGTLAMIARIGKRNAMAVQLLNLNQTVLKQIRGLGIAHMFDFGEREITTDNLKRVHSALSQNTDDMAIAALQAHETLARENPDNQSRFERVIRLLKKDVDAREN